MNGLVVKGKKQKMINRILYGLKLAGIFSAVTAIFLGVVTGAGLGTLP